MRPESPEIPRFRPSIALAGRVWALLGTASATVTAVAVTVIRAWVYPAFSDAFQSIGVVPPLVTRAFASGAPLVWLAPLVLGAMWAFGPRKPGWHLLIGLIGICTVFIAAPVTIFALYLPMMAVNAAI
ncbi:hypothetical protein [Stenotrophomonas sp. Marseille-Q5258]|uniref:hypothetical protein n=1 Tax=Stenotrophomonas sp. Marseille-Q5258 TaxID=2972779 RepID=UPI0021C99E87|nr:hypothetical protein [Stenotrophomonas sp. Marseille-Q5258]